MGALPTLQTSIFDRAHLVGIPTPEHLMDKPIIVTAIVPRIDACKSVPVLGKDLFDDAPSRRSCCSHQAASLQSVGLCVVERFYHILPPTSTLSSARPTARSSTHLALAPQGREGRRKMEIPVRSRYWKSAKRSWARQRARPDQRPQ